MFDGKLVSKTSLEAMKSLEDGYGKALITFPFNEKTFFGHTGGIENFRAVASYNVSENMAIAAIVNGDNFNRNELMIGILSLYYDNPYTFPNIKDFAVSETILKKHEGDYTSKTLPLKIVVKLENGMLTAQATLQGAFSLLAKSESEFVFEAVGIKMIFGENKFVLKQGGGNYLFEKQ